MPTPNLYGQPLGRDITDWVKKSPPEKVTLHGHYCIVCPLSVDHAEDLYHEWQSIDDDRDWTYLSDTKPTTKEQAYHYLRTLSADKEKLFFSVKERDSGSVRGLFCINNIDLYNGNFAISEINWAPSMKRIRLSTEALFLIIHYFIDTLKYRRCEWRTNCLNAPAISSAERIGFKQEGILREKRVTKGHSEDIALFSITAIDWMETAEVLKAWLRRENFDERGRQIKKISDFRTP